MAESTDLLALLTAALEARAKSVHIAAHSSPSGHSTSYTDPSALVKGIGTVRTLDSEAQGLGLGRVGVRMRRGT